MRNVGSWRSGSAPALQEPFSRFRRQKASPKKQEVEGSNPPESKYYFIYININNNNMEIVLGYPTSKYKITMITPAYNEAENIEVVVKSALELVRGGHISNFYVIDDCSADGTAKVAREMGAEVHSLEKNSGKAEAVFYGMLLAARNGSDIMIIIDADLLNPLKPDHVRNFVETLEGKNYSKRKTDVAVYPVIENKWEVGWEKYLEKDLHIGNFTNPDSGMRAFRMERFNFLFRRDNGSVEFSSSRTALRFRKMAFGYGLEDMLNSSVDCCRVEKYVKDIMVFQKPYRKGKEKQVMELAKAQDGIVERRRKYRILMEKRMMGRGYKLGKYEIFAPPRICFGKQ